MKSLLMLTITGEVSYFENNLSESQIKSIDEIAEKISNDKETNTLSEEEVFDIFIKKVKDKLSIDLRAIKISHVFRINI